MAGHVFALEGETGEAQARQLEIFLDAVATQASRSSPYLLHPHYADLLSGRAEAELAASARELSARIACLAGRPGLRQDAGWSELLECLRSCGAEPDRGAG
jgi:hypothetical protein